MQTDILFSHLLPVSFLLGCFSTLKMAVICFSERSVHIRTAWCYIPEDGNIQNDCCENLKSYVKKVLGQSVSSVLMKRASLGLERMCNMKEQQKNVYFFKFLFFGMRELSPLGTSATILSIVPAQDDR
jgi:hypothetical protein